MAGGSGGTSEGRVERPRCTRAGGRGRGSERARGVTGVRREGGSVAGEGGSGQGRAVWRAVLRYLPRRSTRWPVRSRRPPDTRVQETEAVLAAARAARFVRRSTSPALRCVSPASPALPTGEARSGPFRSRGWSLLPSPVAWRHTHVAFSSIDRELSCR